MGESPLINKIIHNMAEFEDTQARVCNFITSTKRWILQNLTNILPDTIIDKISMILFMLITLKIKLLGNLLLMMTFC